MNENMIVKNEYYLFQSKIPLKIIDIKNCKFKVKFLKSKTELNVNPKQLKPILLDIDEDLFLKFGFGRIQCLQDEVKDRYGFVIETYTKFGFYYIFKFICDTSLSHNEKYEFANKYIVFDRDKIDFIFSQLKDNYKSIFNDKNARFESIGELINKLSYIENIDKLEDILISYFDDKIR